MKFSAIILALTFGAAAAFAPVTRSARSSVSGPAPRAAPRTIPCQRRHRSTRRYVPRPRATPPAAWQPHRPVTPSACHRPTPRDLNDTPLGVFSAPATLSQPVPVLRRTTALADSPSRSRQVRVNAEPTGDLNGWVPDENAFAWGLPGSLDPVPEFDPAGFAEGCTLNEMKRYREAEVRYLHTPTCQPLALASSPSPLPSPSPSSSRPAADCRR